MKFKFLYPSNSPSKTNERRKIQKNNFLRTKRAFAVKKRAFSQFLRGVFVESIKLTGFEVVEITFICGTKRFF